MGFTPDDDQGVSCDCGGVKSHPMSFTVCTGIDQQRALCHGQDQLCFKSVVPEGKVVSDGASAVLSKLVLIPTKANNHRYNQDNTTVCLGALSLDDEPIPTSVKSREELAKLTQQKGQQQPSQVGLPSLISSSEPSRVYPDESSSCTSAGSSSDCSETQSQHEESSTTSSCASQDAPRPQTVTSASESQPQVFRSHREKFLVFIKILFKCLDQANEPAIREKAKRIVSECTRRNRQGDPAFSPLMEAVEKRLRGFIGEVQWRKALLLLHHYAKKRMEAIQKERATPNICCSF